MTSSAETPSLAPAPAPSSPVAPSKAAAAAAEDQSNSPEVPAPSASVASPSLPVPEVAPTPSTPKDDLTPAVLSLEATPAPQTPAQTSTNEAPIPSLEQKDEQKPPAHQPIPQTPQIYLTFLLLSGHRRTMNFEPATGIGRVKEVVWGGWNGGDWPAEDRPPAPSYLRVLHAGRMLQDDETLASTSVVIQSLPH
ncbi:hypothetical protein BKA70DRAFT_1426637 [Coprinopsis sp. MPI-PUGE-AT-0042]|nr:hypothetical protein BKA70DRAFT_1426637 [Coprinopsis sp. MPI-PUGE-AT-0042]